MSRQSLTSLQQRTGTFDWGQALALDDIHGEVAIIGVGETAYSGPSQRDCKAMALEAVSAAIDDAGLTPAEVDGLMVHFAIADQITPEDFHGYFGTSHDLWFSDQGGAMIWAATCCHTAAHALREGRVRNVVNVFSVDWASRRAAGQGTPGDWHAQESLKAALELPFGWYPQPLYFATFMQRHMHEFGTTPEQLAAVPLTFRQHAQSHAGAVMADRPMTLADYLAQPLLVDPFRVPDCCLISDGAAAFVMTDAATAKDRSPHPVRVEGVGLGEISGSPYISQQGQLTATPQAFAAPWAYAMADVNAGDIDVIAVYDCFSGTALMQVEDMGFCDKGEGGPFAAEGGLHFERTRHQGGIPCNTHGGLLSHAYVLGIAHVVELVRQLRGTAANQVENARVAAYAGFTAEAASTLILRGDH